MLEQNLVEIGLNEKEAKIYLAALELGQSVVQDISNKASINRATAYFIIEGLMKKGLMSSFHKGKKQFFIAADPDRLAEVLEQEKQSITKREENLKKLLPQLQSINNKQTDKPVVKYYEGKEGIKTMVGEVTMPGKETVRMVYNKDNVLQNFSEKERESWTQDRIKKEIKTKVIYTFKNGALETTPDGERRKVPFEKFPITCDIAVYDNKIRLASFGNRLVGIVIEDKELADSLRAVLDLAWEASEKYQK